MPAPLVALLANEAGMGRGHIAKLKDVALGLGPHVSCVAALARMQFAHDLELAGATLLQAPALRYPKDALKDPTLQGTASWCDYLAAMGLIREEVVRHGLQWWRNQIIVQNASILVADYAPLAMRAANGLQDEGWAIEIVSVGTGYGVPPAHLTAFPQLLPDCSRVVHPEAAVLALVNRVGSEQGLLPLAHLPELYRADLTMAATFAFLDPYISSRPPADLCPPTTPFATTYANQGAGAGDEVFVYFSTRELHDPAILAAVCALPLPRRGYFPAAPAAALAQMAASGVQIETHPVSANAITARSRMVLHAAQHGMICMSALAGLPQLGLPQHMEQLFHGRRARDQGILRLQEARQRGTPAIVDAIQRIYHDRAMQARAFDFARELRDQSVPDPDRDLKARLAPVVARARAAI